MGYRRKHGDGCGFWLLPDQPKGMQPIFVFFDNKKDVFKINVIIIVLRCQCFLSFQNIKRHWRDRVV